MKKAEGKAWNHYESHRHDYVLGKALSLMEKMMPGCLAYMNVEYQTQVAEGGEKYELDGLIIYGSTVLLIEVKGRTMTDSARRGAEKRIATEIERLVSDAHIQAVRAKNYMLGAEEAIFVPQGDTAEIRLHRRNVTSVFMLALTLEPIGYITSMINASTKLDCLKGDLTDLPWMVSIYDLMAIADLIDDPFVFPHYLKCRVRLRKEGITRGGDELDFFGCYLQEGLHYRGHNVTQREFALRITTYTDPIDDYFYHRQGLRRKVIRKPRPQITQPMRLLLRELAQSTSPHRVEVGMALMDMPTKDQAVLVSQMHKCNKKHKKDGRIHNITLHFGDDGGWGFSYAIGHPDVERRLAGYCREKKNELGDRVWFGLARCTSNKGGLLAVMV